MTKGVVIKAGTFIGASRAEPDVEAIAKDEISSSQQDAVLRRLEVLLSIERL